MAREPSRKRKQNLEVLRSPDSTSESRGERVIGESRSLAISRRKFIGAASGGLGLAVIGLGSAACGLLTPASPSPAPSARTTKHLQAIIGNGPNSLDPHLNTSAHAMTLHNAIFDSLTRFDENLRPVPGLATEWKLVNETTWQFSLRKGVKFHDGEDFDATAVKFSLERNLDPNLKSAAISRMPLLSGVDIVDQYTVNVRTSRPAPIIPQNLVWGFIVPPKYVQSVGNDKFAQNPIGTGPFVLDKFVPSQQVELRANSSYWRSAPKVDRLTLRIIGDPAVQISALKAGEAQIVANVPYELAPSVSETRGLKVIQQPWVAVAVANLYSRAPSGPLTDRRVRQALNYAIDKETIVSQLLKGNAQVADGQALTKGCVGYNPDVKAYPYDPARAKQLLSEAGFSNGFELPITVNWGLVPGDKDTSLVIADQLAKVGVAAKISNVETSVFLSLQRGTSGEKTPSTLTAWVNYGDARFALQWGTTNSQFPYFANPDFDRLFAQSESAMDPSVREKLLQQAVRVQHDEAASIYLYQVVNVYGASEKVGGWKSHSSGWMFFDTADLS